MKYWAKYFKDPQYVTVDGKPLVIFFNLVSEEELSGMQEAAQKEGLKNGLAIAGCHHKEQPGFTHVTEYNVIEGWAKGSEAHPYEEVIN